MIACWCQREETPSTPFSPEENEELRFLYEEWAHPYFISIQEFERLMQVRNVSCTLKSFGVEGCWSVKCARSISAGLNGWLASFLTKEYWITLWQRSRISVAHSLLAVVSPHCSKPLLPASQGTGEFQAVGGADWTPETIDSWRHSIWVGVWDPWFVVARPQLWYKVVREIVTLERMHQAFDKGLMQYGMIRGVKKPAAGASPASTESATLVGAQA